MSLKIKSIGSKFFELVHYSFRGLQSNLEFVNGDTHFDDRITKLGKLQIPKIIKNRITLVNSYTSSGVRALNSFSLNIHQCNIFFLWLLVFIRNHSVKNLSLGQWKSSIFEYTYDG